MRAREQVDHEPERRAPEEQQQAEQPDRRDRASGLASDGTATRRPPRPIRASTLTTGQPAVVEDPPGDQPPQDAPRPERVVVERAARELVLRHPLRVGEERDQHPRGGRQRAEAHERRPARPAPEVARRQQHPHAEAQQRQVADQQVEADRDAEHERRERDRSALRDRAPREPPRERQRPHPPELRPRARAAPDVARPFEPERGRAHDERRDEGRHAGRPRLQVEQPPAAVDGDRPRAQQEVERPTERPAAERPWTRCRSGCAAGSGSDGSATRRATGTGYHPSNGRCPSRIRCAAQPTIDRWIPASFRNQTSKSSARSVQRLNPTATPTRTSGRRRARARRLGHADGRRLRARRTRSDRRPSDGRCRSGRSAPWSWRPRGS